MRKKTRRLMSILIALMMILGMLMPGMEVKAARRGTVNVGPPATEESSTSEEQISEQPSEEVPVHRHNWVVVVDKPATCTEHGISHKICSECGCSDGCEYWSQPTEHNWDEGTLAESGEYTTYVCKDCGETKIENHIVFKTYEYKYVYVDPIVIDRSAEKETETVEEETETAEETVEETVCQHTEKEAVLVKPATCVSKPVYNLRCKDCGEIVETNYVKKSDTVDRSNHEHFTSKVTKEPTYKEAGIKTYTCSDCGYTYTEVIPKLTGCTHGKTSVQYNPADGKQYKTCEICGEYLEAVATEETEKTCDHRWTEKKVLIKQATATEWGEYEVHCGKCDELLRTEKIHPYQEYTVQKADGTYETVLGYFDEEAEQAVYRMVNEYRKANGLNELHYNTTTQWASDQRALDCVGYFEHYRPDGSRWNSLTDSWMYGGENIAIGYVSPERVMAAWKASPGHNSNMLYGQKGSWTYKGISVGCFRRIVFDKGSEVPRVYCTTWSQNFTFYEY